MSKYARKILTFTGIGIITYATYHTHSEYKKYITPSPFELAANRLGFDGYKKNNYYISAAEQQEALLKQLQIAGYFKPENLWQAINHLGLIQNPSTVFIQLYSAVRKSKADQNDPSKFNAKILRKNLAKETGLDEQDVIDLILYITQSAFGRKPDQERGELNSQDWMEEYKQDYLEAAKLLRLIDREPPQEQNYDGAWIAGASRIGALARLIDYHYVVSKYGININGEATILAGERKLWAEIDGINPGVRDKLIDAYQTKKDLDIVDISLAVGRDEAAIKEGQEYILNLAERFQIKLNPSNPFIQYKTKEECPPGYFPHRLYPNYVAQESRKLTETLMSQDLITSYFSKNTQLISVVDTLADQHKRPDTATTARDAATKLVDDIISRKYGDQKEFVILFQTNNPYIERQALATQREVNKVLKARKLDGEYKIKIEGVGFKCKQDIATIHSELGALVTEKWKTAVEEQPGGEVLKRPIETLLFQSRDNSLVTDSMPDISEITVSGGQLEEFFFKYLE